MITSFLNKYNVTNVPIWLKPIYYLLSYSLAFFLFSFSSLLRLTCRISVHKSGLINKNSNYIYCCWHCYVPSALTANSFYGLNCVCMQHPAWYMKPIHILLMMTGAKKIILGSSGNSGKEAADKLVEELKNGYSTAIMPDGPHGPAFKIKKGILHISEQSGVPIVPVRFEVSRYSVSKSWDRKINPKPFSRINVFFGEPIKVSSLNFEKSLRILARELQEPVYKDNI